MRRVNGIRYSVYGFVGLVLVFGSQIVAAHAMLTSAEPAAGSTLTTTPEHIILTFSEPIGADSTIKLIGDNFRPIANMPATDHPAPNIVSVNLPPLASGVYTVEYDTFSVDGHIIRGAYEFAIEEEGGRLEWLPILIGILVGVALKLFVRYRRNVVQ